MDRFFHEVIFAGAKISEVRVRTLRVCQVTHLFTIAVTLEKFHMTNRSFKNCFVHAAEVAALIEEAAQQARTKDN
jgi:hypothetical protein